MKYKKRYGRTREELAIELKVSNVTVTNWQRRDVLADVISTGKKPKSRCKYRRLYGFSTIEIAEKLNRNVGRVPKMHYSGELAIIFKKTI